MNRIDAIFRDARRDGRGLLMPYLTAGDPDLKTTGELLPVLEQAGASVCEIGIPFSDPIADGPVIEAAMSRALAGGARPAGVLEMVADRREALSMGLLAMVSYSICYRLGPGFIRDAVQAGFDGFIVPDLPLEEAGPMLEEVEASDAALAFLIAPTTPPERARRLAGVSRGFVYALARAGITGARERLAGDLAERVARLRAMTDLPLAVGFGISRPGHVRQVLEHADAAIVGSALVREIDRHARRPRPEMLERVGAFVAELAGGAEEAPNPRPAGAPAPPPPRDRET